MKSFLFYLTTLLGCQFLFGLVQAEEWPEAKADQAVRRMSTLIGQSAKRIQSKYGVTCIGSGAAMCGGPIREVRLSFQISGPLAKPELRSLPLARRRPDQRSKRVHVQPPIWVEKYMR